MLRAAENVARSVKLLDRERPGWHREIDLDRLHMSHPYDCVLGQLYGSYASGVAALGLQHGHDPVAFVCESIYGAEWRRFIGRRRGRPRGPLTKLRSFFRRTWP